MEGWVDNTHEDALTHTVRLSDDDCGVELSVVALPSPTYAIREARARGTSGTIDPAALEGLTGLVGTAMVAGLTRRVREATGNGAGAALLLEATIEVARLARQVAKLPRDLAEHAAGAGAWECWQLDTAGWVDLPDSCFTYSAAGRALFGSRTVTTATTADLYSPRPGQQRVFQRRKVARLELSTDRLLLFHSMQDNVHGFELTYEVDLGTDRIVRAEATTPKLPYPEICAEPQRRLQALVGETLDTGLGKRIQSLIGGATGCAQLYDLTSDLVRLVGPSPRPVS
jgi:hypothetical protein